MTIRRRIRSPAGRQRDVRPSTSRRARRARRSTRRRSLHRLAERATAVTGFIGRRLRRSGRHLRVSALHAARATVGVRRAALLRAAGNPSARAQRRRAVRQTAHSRRSSTPFARGTSHRAGAASGQGVALAGGAVGHARRSARCSSRLPVGAGLSVDAAAAAAAGRSSAPVSPAVGARARRNIRRRWRSAGRRGGSPGTSARSAPSCTRTVAAVRVGRARARRRPRRRGCPQNPAAHPGHSSHPRARTAVRQAAHPTGSADRRSVSLAAHRAAHSARAAGVGARRHGLTVGVADGRRRTGRRVHAREQQSLARGAGGARRPRSRRSAARAAPSARPRGGTRASRSAASNTTSRMLAADAPVNERLDRLKVAARRRASGVTGGEPARELFQVAARQSRVPARPSPSDSALVHRAAHALPRCRAPRGAAASARSKSARAAPTRACRISMLGGGVERVLPHRRGCASSGRAHGTRAIASFRRPAWLQRLGAQIAELVAASGQGRAAGRAAASFASAASATSRRARAASSVAHAGACRARRVFWQTRDASPQPAARSIAGRRHRHRLSGRVSGYVGRRRRRHLVVQCRHDRRDAFTGRQQSVASVVGELTPGHVPRRRRRASRATLAFTVNLVPRTSTRKWSGVDDRKRFARRVGATPPRRSWPSSRWIADVARAALEHQVRRARRWCSAARCRAAAQPVRSPQAPRDGAPSEPRLLARQSGARRPTSVAVQLAGSTQPTRWRGGAATGTKPQRHQRRRPRPSSSPIQIAQPRPRAGRVAAPSPGPAGARPQSACGASVIASGAAGVACRIAGTSARHNAARSRQCAHDSRWACNRTLAAGSSSSSTASTRRDSISSHAPRSRVVSAVSSDVTSPGLLEPLFNPAARVVDADLHGAIDALTIAATSSME